MKQNQFCQEREGDWSLGGRRHEGWSQEGRSHLENSLTEEGNLRDKHAPKERQNFNGRTEKGDRAEKKGDRTDKRDRSEKKEDRAEKKVDRAEQKVERTEKKGDRTDKKGDRKEKRDRAEKMEHKKRHMKRKITDRMMADQPPGLGKPWIMRETDRE